MGDEVATWLTLLQNGGLPTALIAFIAGLLREWWVLGSSHQQIVALYQRTIASRDASIAARDEAIAARDRRIQELTTMAVQHASTIDRAVSVVERQRS